jgi:serine/threonine-protein kinase
VAPDADSPEVRGGDVLAGKYLLLAPLAVGGMSRLWTARNLMTGAEVAAKVLLPAFATEAGLTRFRREAEAVGSLSHRAIVRVFDLVELDAERGSLLMVMELLRGHTLARELEHMGPLSVEETFEIALPLLSALAHVHALGIVHRDLKPENVFLAVDPDGQRMPKLVDFGISKQMRASPITLDGQIVGTLRYMSPEQTLGSAIDPRSDVFSFGILLYECLVGKNPFLSATSGGGWSAHVLTPFAIEPPPPGRVPPALWQVIRRSLATQAEDRFASVVDLAAALRAAVPSSPAATLRSSPLTRSSTTPPIAPVAPSPPRGARIQRRVAVAAALALAGLVAVAFPARTTSARAELERRGVATLLAHHKHATEGVEVLRELPPAPLAAVATAPLGPDPRSLGRTKPVIFPMSRAELARVHSGQTFLATRGAVALMRDPGF